jgi:XTP/dITP diphosphohydrolase
MHVWIGTFNSNKVREYKYLSQILLPNLEIHTASEIPGYSAPPENGDSFVENARIKAKSLAAIKSGVWVIGEDSGLVVNGLGGLPGIHSARYAGDKASDSENIAKLLKMIQLKGVLDKSARFECALVAISPEGKEFVYRGVLNGQILDKPRGVHGFGYDPVFLPEGQSQSLAELGLGFKNQFSHRAQAFKLWLDEVKGGL